MKRFLGIFLTVLLVFGAVGWVTAESTVPYGPKQGNAFIGSLTFKPLSGSTRTLIDTLLTTTADTSSSVKIAGAKSVSLWFVIDPKGAKGNNLTVTPQLSVDGTYWKDITPAWSLGASTTEATYQAVLVAPAGADSTVAGAPFGSGAWAAQARGAKYLRTIVTDLATTSTKDTVFVNSLKYNVVH